MFVVADPAESSEPIEEFAELQLEDGPEDLEGSESDAEAEAEADEEHITDHDAADASEGSSGSAQSKLEQQKVQDALLLQTVLLATKYVIKDKQLPMLVSTYWSLLQRYVYDICLRVYLCTVRVS